MRADLMDGSVVPVGNMLTAGAYGNFSSSPSNRYTAPQKLDRIYFPADSWWAILGLVVRLGQNW